MSTKSSTLTRLTRRLGPLQEIATAIRSNRLGVLGLAMFVITVTPVVLAPLIAPHDPGTHNLTQTFIAPSIEHPFGTDNYGRDVFSRVLHGGRVSISISLIGVTIALTLGSIIGVSAGYYGGWYDEGVMRVIDTLMAFPSYVLAMLLLPIIGGASGIILAIGLVFTPNFARLSRGSTLAVKEEEYIDAARSLGFSNGKIMRSDIYPNVIAPILVQLAISSGYGIIIESGLSFLGLGVQGMASWGIVLAEGRQFLNAAPWIIVLTGVYMTVVILSLNLIGDALRDALDPKIKDEIGGTKE